MHSPHFRELPRNLQVTERIVMKIPYELALCAQKRGCRDVFAWNHARSIKDSTLSENGSQVASFCHARGAHSASAGILTVDGRTVLSVGDIFLRGNPAETSLVGDGGLQEFAVYRNSMLTREFESFGGCLRGPGWKVAVLSGTRFLCF